MSWEQFAEDCGKIQILNNGLKAKQMFISQYKNNIVQWEGIYLYQKERTVQAIVSLEIVEVNERLIFLKMNPSETYGDIADISLKYDNKMMNNTMQEKWENLSKTPVGTILKFNASFLNLGDDYHFHELRLHGLEITNNTIKIEDIPTIQNKSKPRKNLLRKSLPKNNTTNIL